MTSLVPYRIRYLRQQYFSEMPADTLHAKIAAEVKVTKKTVENWLAGKPSKISARYAAEPAAALFAAKHTKDSERAQVIKTELANFILNGAPSPFVVLSGHKAEFGLQLTVEHLLPFIDEVRAKDLLSKTISPDEWGDVRELQAAQAFLRGDTPNNWAMLNAVAIVRPEERGLLDAALRSQLVILTSAAGDGKSTMLRRLAMRLKEGKQEVHFFPRLRSVSRFHLLQSSIYPPMCSSIVRNWRRRTVS
jgi:hypothetical protein